MARRRPAGSAAAIVGLVAASSSAARGPTSTSSAAIRAGVLAHAGHDHGRRRADHGGRIDADDRTADTAATGATASGSSSDASSARDVDVSDRLAAPATGSRRSCSGQSTTAVGRTGARDRHRSRSTAATVQRRRLLRRHDDRARATRTQRDSQFQRPGIMDTSTQYPDGDVQADDSRSTSARSRPNGEADHGRGHRRPDAATARRSRVTVRRAGRRKDGSHRSRWSAQIPIVFADSGIPNPSLGPASTEDHGHPRGQLAPVQRGRRRDAVRR